MLPISSATSASAKVGTKREREEGQKKTYILTISGNPVPKARPRFSPHSKRVWADERTKLAELRVGWTWREQYCTDQLSGPLELRCVFLCKDKRHGDLSNLVKLVEDGLNGVAYRDDKQIKELRAMVGVADPDKGETPCTVLTLREFQGREDQS